MLQTKTQCVIFQTTVRLYLAGLQGETTLPTLNSVYNQCPAVSRGSCSHRLGPPGPAEPARLHICIPRPLAFWREAGGSPQAFPVHLCRDLLTEGLGRGTLLHLDSAPFTSCPFSLAVPLPRVHKEAEAEEAFGSLLPCMC